MAGIKIVDLPALGRDLINTDLLEVSLNGSGSRKITGQEIMNASKLAVGSTPIVSGTVGRLLFQNTGDVLGQSGSLFWDNTNGRLGIGGTPGAYKLDVLGVIKTSSIYGKGDGTSDRYFTFDLEKPTGAIPSIVFGAYDNNATRYLAIGGEAGSSKYATQFIYFFTGATNTTVAGTRAMAILPSGNVNIGSSITDAGFKLDVNGTARVSGVVTLNNTSGTNRSTDLRTSNSIDNLPTTTFYPSSGTNVGQSFQVIPRGTGFSAGIKAQFALSGTDTIADGTNFEAMVVRATGSAFTFASGKGGTGVVRPMLFSSGFLDGVTNANQLWLYSTGNVGINTSTDNGFLLDVNGTARVKGGNNNSLIIDNDGSQYSSAYIRHNGNTRMQLTWDSSANSGYIGSVNTSATTLQLRAGIGSTFMILHGTGNVGIGTTTDAGYKLDVNGDTILRRVTFITPSTITGGTEFFRVQSGNGFSPLIRGYENGVLNLGSSSGSIGFNNASFNLPVGSFFSFNYVPANILNTYAFLLTANYTNVGAGGTSEGAMLRTTGSTATSVGNVTMNQIEMKPTYNNTGGTTINRGFYYNPTLTSMTGTTHFAIHSTSGRVRLEGLPTSPTGLNAGDLYNNLGVLMIV